MLCFHGRLIEFLCITMIFAQAKANRDQIYKVVPCTVDQLLIYSKYPNLPLDMLLLPSSALLQGRSSLYSLIPRHPRRR
jgi:hypothetical protein